MVWNCTDRLSLEVMVRISWLAGYGKLVGSTYACGARRLLRLIEWRRSFFGPGCIPYIPFPSRNHGRLQGSARRDYQSRGTCSNSRPLFTPKVRTLKSPTSRAFDATAWKDVLAKSPSEADRDGVEPT